MASATGATDDRRSRRADRLARVRRSPRHPGHGHVPPRAPPVDMPGVAGSQGRRSTPVVVVRAVPGLWWLAGDLATELFEVPLGEALLQLAARKGEHLL